MTPIIPNPKESWKICAKQLQNLDNTILSCYPAAKLSEGVKYGRWAQVDDQTSVSVFSNEYEPDNMFDGMLIGKKVKILMWLPFFN